MGMAAQHLVGYVLGDIIEIEQTLFFGDTRVENDVEQQIPEFFPQVVNVITLDGINQLVGFVERMAGDTATGLADIPGAAAFGIRRSTMT